MVKRLNERKNIETVFLVFIFVIFIVIANKYFNFFYIKKPKLILTNKITSINIDNVNPYLEYRKEANLIISKNTKHRAGKTKSIPILLYHGVVNNPKNKEEISIDTFKKQMFLLKKNGYETITMSDFYDFVKNGKLFPEKTFMITFDDGRKDSYYTTDPILDALNYNAVMFVITRHINEKSKYYLNKDELKNIINTSRWEIESHGRNDHDYIFVNKEHDIGRYMSNKMWLDAQDRLESDDEYRDRILTDLRESKKDIKTEFGINAIAFALPAGDYGQVEKIKNIVINSLKKVYPLSFFQFRPEAEFGYFRTNYRNFLDNSYFFRRIKITKNINEYDLLNMLNASADKKLPYVDSFKNKNNWINGWGENIMSENSYILKSMPNEKSAGMYLDGSYLWNNYQFTLTAKLIKGKSYSVEALTSKGKTFVGCNYSNNKLKIYTSFDGNTEKKGELKINNFNVNIDQNVGITTFKNHFYCMIDGNNVLKAAYGHSFANGSISIKVYGDNVYDGAKLDVKNIYVKKNNTK